MPRILLIPRTLSFLAVLLLTHAVHGVEGSQPLETQVSFEKGDRVVILGGTLAERMQHDGWLETLFQSRIPETQLTFRNLGFSADSLNHQLRVAGFGSQEKWLEKTNPDWIFAFFGFNESFEGEAGIKKFKEDLQKFIHEQKTKKYNGEVPPQLVLFSPMFWRR